MDFYFKKVNSLRIRNWLSNELSLNNDDGKLVYSDTFVDNGTVHVQPTVRGGKGDSGSLPHAVGAQIKKTSNNEDSRGINRRYLRDVIAEPRLRKKEARERRELEKLCEPPKHEFNDEYNEERSILPENVEDDVLQGLQATASSSTKRKVEQREAVYRKRPKLWIKPELKYDTSDDDDDDD